MNENNIIKTNIMVDDFLEHHGIKGMKWGIRRYQNADGTLTEAGRKRYNSGEAILNKWGGQEGLANAKVARNTVAIELASPIAGSSVGALAGVGLGALAGNPLMGVVAGATLGQLAGSIGSGIAFVNGTGKQGRVTDAYNARHNK